MPWKTIDQIRNTIDDECAGCGEPCADSGWVVLAHVDYPFKATRIYHGECHEEGE